MPLLVPLTASLHVRPASSCQTACLTAEEMIVCATCAITMLLAALSPAHVQAIPPPAPATSPTPSMSITLLGPGPAPAMTQMPVNGKLPQLAGTRFQCGMLAGSLPQPRTSPCTELGSSIMELKH